MNEKGPVFWVGVVVGTCALLCTFYCIVRSARAVAILRKNRNLKIEELNKANRAKEVELALAKLKEQAVADANKTAEVEKPTDGSEQPLVQEPEREEVIDLFYPNDADFNTIEGKRNILDPGKHYNEHADANAQRYHQRK